MHRLEFSIPLNERVPEGYRRRFVLVLEAGQHEIEVRQKEGMVYRFAGSSGPQTGLALDWIQETVDGIRAELNGLEGGQ